MFSEDGFVLPKRIDRSVLVSPLEVFLIRGESGLMRTLKRLRSPGTVFIFPAVGDESVVALLR